jgi:oleate hydratase
MKYSNGNYAAFRTPTKIINASMKRVYLVGGGLASLASAVFLIRDVGIPGKNITILEQTKILGGAVDGVAMPNNAYCNRGGRELEDHMECL